MRNEGLAGTVATFISILAGKGMSFRFIVLLEMESLIFRRLNLNLPKIRQLKCANRSFELEGEI